VEYILALKRKALIALAVPLLLIGIAAAVFALIISSLNKPVKNLREFANALTSGTETAETGPKPDQVFNTAKRTKRKKRLFDFLVNIATLGRYKEKSEFGMSDHLIRYALLNFIILFGVLILAVFIVLNVKLGRYSTAVICASMILAGLVSFTLARTEIRQFIPALILMIFYGLLCVMIT